MGTVTTTTPPPSAPAERKARSLRPGAPRSLTRRDTPRGPREAATPSDLARIVCVDEHAFVADWLQGVYDDHGVNIAAHIDAPEQLIETVDRTGAQAVVTEVVLKGRDPLTAVEDLLRVQRNVRVVVLSGSTALHHVQAALRAGAVGYFGKSDPPEAIASGILRALDGRLSLGPSIRRAWPELAEYDGQRAGRVEAKRVRTPSKLASLSPREFEVFRLIGQGLHRTDIAGMLRRSPKTVDKHRAAVMRKLGIHDRAELVLYAVRQGVVPI